MKSQIEILSVLYGPYECTALFVSGITSSIGKKEREAMQKAIACVLDGDMEPRPNLRAPHITPNDVDCKGCPERRPGLVWSAKPPTVPGWYWWKCLDHIEEGPQAVYIKAGTNYQRGYLVMFFLYNGLTYHHCDKCRLAGPIPIPEEPVS